MQRVLVERFTMTVRWKHPYESMSVTSYAMESVNVHQKREFAGTRVSIAFVVENIRKKETGNRIESVKATRQFLQLSDLFYVIRAMSIISINQSSSCLNSLSNNIFFVYVISYS